MSTTPITPSRTVDDATLRSPLSSRSRPPRASALSASLAFTWRALLKIKHVPEQLVDVIGIPILFTLLFTYLFGGALLGDLGRYLLASTLVIVLGLALGFRPAGGAAGVLVAVALVLAFAFGLSWIWTTLALVLRTPSAVQNLGLLILFPLTFASNVFVDPKTMPGWLQAFVDVNPVSRLVTAVRGLMHGTATTGQVGWVLLAAALSHGGLCAAHNAPLPQALRKRVRHERKPPFEVNAPKGTAK